MRSQQHLFTLVNAMVSHELRNPLNALLGQLLKVKSIRRALQDLIHQISEKLNDQSILDLAISIDEDIELSVKKLS